MRGPFKSIFDVVAKNWIYSAEKQVNINRYKTVQDLFVVKYHVTGMKSHDTCDNLAATLRPEAVLRAIRRLGTPASRGATPAAPAATAATAAIAAANDRRDHHEPTTSVPGKA